ncbi:hypothetical protein BDZ91DRAFT_293979 [Kalaharituber pfeilii]|nr:hypothetical protein BDZ91DRAFT_293979 [Kalaharituber pfeilii]
MFLPPRQRDGLLLLMSARGSNSNAPVGFKPPQIPRRWPVHAMGNRLLSKLRSRGAQNVIRKRGGSKFLILTGYLCHGMELEV